MVFWPITGLTNTVTERTNPVDPNSAIKKYYAGFALLLVLLIGVLGYTVVKAGDAKTDRATNKGVEKISNKLGYGSSVPDSLAAAGITGLPDTIKYTKLSSTQYKICITYKQASGMFDAGWTSLFGGSFSGGASDYNTQNSSYFDSYVIYKHKKGENCQTVKPNTYSSDYYGSPSSSSGSSGSSTANSCSYPSDALNVSGDVTISKIDTANKTIYFQSNEQYLYDYSNSADVTVTSKLYDSTTLVCDGKALTKTDISAIKAGDRVTIYLKTANDTAISQISTTYIFGN